MKNKGAPIIIGILMIVTIAAVGIVLYYNGKDDGEIIGGEEDAHGCLIGAGYSWNKSIGACVREWELNADERKAAEMAIAPLSFPVTVVEVETLRCVGCFIVTLQRNDNQKRLTIKIANWQIEESSSAGKNYCTLKQRNTQVCTMEYAPVCGWFDESIQCIRYPCASTYSNPCMACSNENVAYPIFRLNINICGIYNRSLPAINLLS